MIITLIIVSKRIKCLEIHLTEEEQDLYLESYIPFGMVKTMGTSDGLGHTTR